MQPHGRRFFALALGLAAATSACRRESPAPAREEAAASPAAAEFSVSAIELGRGIGPDKRVTGATTSFGPRDTIYVSVATEGAAPSTRIAAKWTYEDGQVVSEDSETISPSGPAATEFHIAKPSGWPAGKYTVAITVDGEPAGSKEFEVTR